MRTLGSLAALVAVAGLLALLEAATRCPWWGLAALLPGLPPVTLAVLGRSSAG